MKYLLITATTVLSILAVAGCFPKLPTIPDLPDLPDLPEVPELPEVEIPTIAPDNVLPDLPVNTAPSAGNFPRLK